MLIFFFFFFFVLASKCDTKTNHIVLERIDSKGTTELYCHDHINGFKSAKQGVDRYKFIQLKCIYGINLKQYNDIKFWPCAICSVQLNIFGLNWNTGLRDKCLYWAAGM